MHFCSWRETLSFFLSFLAWSNADLEEIISRLQIDHPASLYSPLWCSWHIQIFHLGSHVLRLWLPFQQSLSSDIRLHSDWTILVRGGSRPRPWPLHRPTRGRLGLWFYELHFWFLHLRITSANGLAVATISERQTRHHPHFYGRRSVRAQRQRSHFVARILTNY